MTSKENTAVKVLNKDLISHLGFYHILITNSENKAENGGNFKGKKTPRSASTWVILLCCPHTGSVAASFLSCVTHSSFWSSSSFLVAVFFIPMLQPDGRKSRQRFIRCLWNNFNSKPMNHCDSLNKPNESLKISLDRNQSTTESIYHLPGCVIICKESTRIPTSNSTDLTTLKSWNDSQVIRIVNCNEPFSLCVNTVRM